MIIFDIVEYDDYYCHLHTDLKKNRVLNLQDSLVESLLCSRIQQLLFELLWYWMRFDKRILHDDCPLNQEISSNEII